ncbi:uncharacterized protein LOC122505617 isoform X1 [Leptopilina heterotoma]|uniref:uncharacterized protein LOC122505617 isoform X1 n=1 Tax=Leptopilina heterotoma TaxID=63436 RepID=UPI001CA8F7B5|nr:uncharacterized protein LOC122505617 isoform X1 [Leptopilina heterotoma]XP_043473289.1 uncharacterized protein LOC122505617 isoform X1 [Leptopilina heterotoma]
MKILSLYQSPIGYTIMSHIFNNRYFYVNKFFLSCIGQWPFHSTRRNLAIQCFIILHLFISFTSKATGFLKTCGNSNRITEGMPTIFVGFTSLSFSIIFFFKQEKVKFPVFANRTYYLTFFLFFKNVKYKVHNNKKYLQLNKLYREIKFDWECLSSNQEEFIISKRANRRRCLTIFFTGCIIGALITYGIISTLHVFNFLLVNKSQPNEWTFQIYYSVTYSEKHFYLIILYFSFNTVLETCIFISFELVLSISIEHACGSFEKIGLCIQKIHSYQTEIENLKAVTYCVSQHNRAIEFCDSIESLYWPCFMCIVTLKRFFISVSFIQVFAHSNNFTGSVKYGAFVASCIVYLFYNTLFARRIIDYSTSLTDTVYNTFWYQMPSRIKKSLLLIMIRSRIPCRISAVKLLNISLEFLLTFYILICRLDTARILH